MSDLFHGSLDTMRAPKHQKQKQNSVPTISFLTSFDFLFTFKLMEKDGVRILLPLN